MVIMQIRSLQWRGIPVWPPEWWISDQETGEEGILEEVRLHMNRTPALINIVANHLGDSRNGIIILEGSVQLDILYHKLKENIGRPLKEIGDLEIDLSTPLQKRGQKQARPHRAPRPKAIKNV
jgi:hypothetical protein